MIRSGLERGDYNETNLDILRGLYVIRTAHGHFANEGNFIVDLNTVFGSFRSHLFLLRLRIKLPCEYYLCEGKPLWVYSFAMYNQLVFGGRTINAH